MNDKPMNSKKLLATLSLLLIFLCSSVAIGKVVKDADSILGIWITGESKAQIEIYKKGNKYFGKIVWMIEPLEADGSLKKDINNPNEKLRNQTIKGLEILRGFEYEGDNEWVDGKIYDPESGSDYSCKITLRKDGKLDVRGYIGISLFGRSDVWTRKK